MLRFKHLSAFARSTVYGIFGILIVTGIAWMYAQLRVEDPVWEYIPNLLMKIHGAVAMLALILLGYLFKHIKIGWRMKKNRTSGLGVLFVYVFLIVSGYSLYYAGDENSRTFISRWHSWIGIATMVVLALHVIIGRSIRLHRESRARHSGTATQQTSDPALL
jgi:hypothetical protein